MLALNSMAEVTQAGFQAEAIKAQGEAQAQASMASGIGSMVSGIAGGFGSFGSGGGGGSYIPKTSGIDYSSAFR